MRKHLLILLITITVNTAFADIAYPKYKKEEQAFIISGTEKFKQYDWYCKIDYKMHPAEEYTLTDDFFILKDIFYDERFPPVFIWAVHKTTGIKTEVAEYNLPDSKFHLKIKGVKKNKIKIKEVRNSDVLLLGANINIPTEKTNKPWLLPLLLVSVFSVFSLYFIHKYLSPKKLAQ